MDIITTQQDTSELDALENRVVADIESTIICNNKGNRAILISLDEFSSWQENYIYYPILLTPSISLVQFNQQKQVRMK